MGQSAYQWFFALTLLLVSACTTATHCIGMAARLIAHGDADVMLAGGAEHGITPLGLGGFCAARALSQRNDDPTTASRPWDKERDGFVLSDVEAADVSSGDSKTNFAATVRY